MTKAEVREQKIAEIVRQNFVAWTFTDDERNRESLKSAASAAWDAAMEHAAQHLELSATLVQGESSPIKLSRAVMNDCAAALRREAHESNEKEK